MIMCDQFAIHCKFNNCLYIFFKVISGILIPSYRSELPFGVIFLQTKQLPLAFLRSPSRRSLDNESLYFNLSENDFILLLFLNIKFWIDFPSFFLYFKHVIASSLVFVFWEKLAVTHIVSPICHLCFSLAAFKLFSLCLDFRKLTAVCLDMVFFAFILLGLFECLGSLS